MSQTYGASASFSARMAGPYGNSGGSAKLTAIPLTLENWKGAQSPYSQVVAMEDVSVNSKVDLQLDADQVSSLWDAGIALTAVNDGGVVTVYAIGNKPSEDCVIQATVEEVTG